MLFCSCSARLQGAELLGKPVGTNTFLWENWELLCSMQHLVHCEVFEWIYLLYVCVSLQQNLLPCCIITAMYYSVMEKQGISDPGFKFSVYRKEEAKWFEYQWWFSSHPKVFLNTKLNANCLIFPLGTAIFIFKSRYQIADATYLGRSSLGK